MKHSHFLKTLLLLFAITFAQKATYAQSTSPLPSDCKMPSIPLNSSPSDNINCAHSTQYWSKESLYIPTSSQKYLDINLNFFFMQKDDGTGSFRLNNPEEMAFITEFVGFANWRINDFYNVSGICSTPSKPNKQFVPAIKLRLVPKMYEIKNNKTVFIPADDDQSGSCPYGSAWVYKQLNTKLHNDPLYKNGINVYFANEEKLWNDFADTINYKPPYIEDYGLRYWCAEYPNTYDLEAPLASVIRNLYVKYRKFKAGIIFNGTPTPYSTTKPWLIGEGILLAHEIFHNLGLEDQTYCDLEVMYNKGNTPKEFIYASDASTCHKSLSLTNARQFVDCDQHYSTNRFVTFDEKWDAEMRLYNNVVVTSGATLTVTCKLLMAQNASITVERGAKLIIDGGTITTANTCYKDESWQGIYVWGNSNKLQPSLTGKLDPDGAGVVILKNNALIEHAQTAISTSAPSQKWPQYADYYGGVIYAENCTFINNTRAVEFMSYKYPNKSTFKNCTFKEKGNWRDMTIGVTIWDCHQILFEYNTFEQLDVSGIMGIDFDANVVTKNNFKKMQYGIESYSTSPSVSKLNVVDNVFENNGIDIVSQATSKQESLTIAENKFNSSEVGIIMEGPTSYGIYQNTFKNSIAGVISRETSDYQNRVSCNLFKTQYGIDFVGDNSQTQFKQNEFNTTADVLLYKTDNSKGRINEYQGDANFAASNCFTIDGNHITADPKNTDWFFYLSPAKSIGECYTPKNNITDGGTNNYEFKPDYKFPSECVKSIPPPSITDGEIETIKSHNPDFTFPPVFTEDHIRQTEIGEQIDVQHYDVAMELLSLYQATTKDAIQFKAIQSINLERLKADGNYMLSSSKYSKLYTYATTDLPSSAYAKSLLLLLKGERFPFTTGNLDLVRGRNAQKRNDANPNGLSEIVLAPNPNEGYFRLSLNKQRIDDGVFRLIDMFGHVVYTQKINSLGYEDFDIDVTNLCSGLYHAQLVYGDRFSWETKILIHTN